MVDPRSAGALLIAAAGLALLPAAGARGSGGPNNGHNVRREAAQSAGEEEEGRRHRRRRHYPVLACPAAVPAAVNADEHQRAWYDAPSAAILGNETDYLRAVRDSEEFDNWGHSYAQVKASMRDVKVRFFAPHLTDGMSIYESASGIGLNLLMTLEVLEEEGIGGLVVYGNEYVQDSVTVSRQILGAPDLPGRGHLGGVCQADSSQLHHVPSDAFDLVYTGYITPLLNPLNLEVTDHGLRQAQNRLCAEAEAGEPDKAAMVARAQLLQEEWYRAWVGEMIRIARPGAPVIVEQVSYPQCDVYSDWGGVDLGFWRTGIARFGWDIDPASIHFEDETLFGDRYHVFMRKNPRRQGIQIA